jgi:Amt family ammonium transporter
MGFNPGSTLGATDLRISVIAVNTNLAAVAGAATAMVVWAMMFKKPDISMACNGMLAGLVAITAPCAFVSSNSSVIIGIVAGVVVCLGVLLNERVLKIDDPCGAISVHGYCGWLGAVCVGIFADGTYGAGWNGVGASSYLGTAGQGVTGLLYGDTSQFLCQLLGSTVCVAWAFGPTFVTFKVVNAVKSMCRGGSRARRPRRARVRHAGVPRGRGRGGGQAVPDRVDRHPSRWRLPAGGTDASAPTLVAAQAK